MAMATTGEARSHSALDAVLDIHRVRQYFNVLASARAAAAAFRKDMSFVDAVRRAVAPLPLIITRHPRMSSDRSAAQRLRGSEAGSAW
jgi:hypothetical protein